MLQDTLMTEKIFMTEQDRPALELLAPAGTLAAFEAAVAAGADAVYIGAPALNARALAKQFTLAEIAAMVDHAHRHRVKVYVAMNSLVKEAEIPAAVETLAALEALAVDALILQDLGLYWLARQHFPKLRLHASTLLAGHNSVAVRHFTDMGFQRVVLARELTLKEIAAIHGQTAVELEVFVHGALCFSYSGLCMFSSYLGGKSGLRGRCVQPCRRRYTWSGKGKGKGGGQSGYFFSMNDLAAIDLLPQLAAAGVRSLKIEGRMRSPRYVGAVVSAYRRVLDAPPGDAAALAEAHAWLDEAMGRRSTSGYFTTPQPDDALSPQHSGNVGHFLGRIDVCRGHWAQFTVRAPLRCGDRLRLHREKSGDRQAFTLKGIKVGGEVVDSAAPGTEVAVELPDPGRLGDSLYKVDSSDRRGAQAVRAEIEPGRFRKQVPMKGIADRASRVLAALRQAGVRSAADGHGVGPRSRSLPARSGKKNSDRNLAWWLRVDDLQLLAHPLPELPERIVVTLTPKTASQLQRQRRQLGPLLKRLVWALPPIIVEADLPFYREAIAALGRNGFTDWQLGHVGQLPLFSPATGGEGKKGGGRRPPRGGGRFNLSGDYTLNILNSLALRCVGGMGIGRTQLAVETDRDNLRLLAAGQGAATGIFLHGAVPLFIARLKAGHFHYDRPFVSPKGERFVLKEAWGQTIAVSETVFSLLDRREELAGFGLNYGVIDLSHLRLRKGDLETLVQQVAGTGRGRKPLRQRTNAFNYLGGLE